MAEDKYNKLKCAICETAAYSSVLFQPTFNLKNIDSAVFSARRLPDRIHYQLNRCSHCGLIYSSPILSYETIKHLYNTSHVTYENEIESLQKTYKQYLLRALKYLPHNPKLLEIGAGNGFFLEMCLELGLKNPIGIEPSKNAYDNASKKIQKYLVHDFFPSEKIHKNSIDIICIFQTLDHIIDVNDFLTHCYSVLKKGGIVLSILHNTDGLSVKLFGKKSPIFDIEHIYLFNKSNLQKIFQKNNFSPLETFDVVNTFPLRYWVRMLPIHSAIKKSLMQLLTMLHLEKALLKFSVGNIGCIAKKI